MIITKNIIPKMYPPISSFKGRLSAKTYKDPTGKDCLGINVYLHCLTSGLVCKRLLEKDISPEDIIGWLDMPINLICFLVSCHDVGKISPGFQAMLRKADHPDYLDYDKYGSYRHEVVSYEHVKRMFGRDLSKVILYHHGYYRNDRDTDYFYISNDEWSKERTKIVNDLAKAFDIDILGIDSSIVLDVVRLKYLGGLLCMCDWISSDTEFFPSDVYKEESIVSRIEESVHTYGFKKMPISDIPFMDFKKWSGYTPNAIQNKMLSVIQSPGVYILEAPMGLGKTEAALYPAMDLYRRGIVSGIYFSTPTQITSNRILDRVKEYINKWFQCDKVHLIHYNSDIYQSQDKDDWYRGNKKALLDDFGAGTVDQISLSVIPHIKYFFLRTFGMYKKAIIIDEVHSYDTYTSSLIKGLIRDLVDMDCVVIILTATLTKKARGELLNV